jgi:hypothetical protein
MNFDQFFDAVGDQIDLEVGKETGAVLLFNAKNGGAFNDFYDADESTLTSDEASKVAEKILKQAKKDKDFLQNNA